MTNRVILVRHGRSTGNDDNTFYKHHIDSAVCLTELGVRQALNAGEQLKSIHGGHLKWKWHGVLAYASEYTRAQQTARIVLDKMDLQHLDYKIEPAINERQYGDNDIPNDFHKNPEATCFNGETLIQCKNRFASWWKNVAEPNLSQRDIILFCHGELLKCATAAIMDLSNDELVRVSAPNGVPFIYEKTDNGYVASPHRFSRFDATVKEVIH